MDQTLVAEISADAIRRNIEAIRRRVGVGRPICAAVKANAYGHDVGLVLPILSDAGVEQVAVADLDEALDIRRRGWHRPILCFGNALLGCSERESMERAAEAVAADIHCTILSPEQARLAAQAAERLHRAAHIEIKVDSGMGRMGLLAADAVEAIAEIARCPNVVVEGVYTHFATADEPDLTFARQQLAAFQELTSRLRAAGVPVRAFHAANSAAIFRLPEAHLDRVRPGIAVYGYWDSPIDERPADLHPAMRVVSRITAVRRLPAGHCVGYGRTFTTGRETVVGVVQIGYGDGYRRLLSNDAVMPLEPARGLPRRAVPVIGRVSMDQTLVDLTVAGDVRPADRIIVIDNDPAAPNSVEALARRLQTISYEITCLIGPRVRRVAV